MTDAGAPEVSADVGTPAKLFAFQPTAFADLTMRTSDGYTLQLHRAVIARSCTVWSDMLTAVKSGAEAVPVEETWEQLRPLLLYIYPEGAQGDPPIKSAAGWAR